MSSSEVYIQCSTDENPIAFKRSIIEEVLGPHAVVRNGKILGAKFSDRDFGDIDGAEEEDVTYLSFEGGGERFMQAIWEIADRAKAYMFWIGSFPCLAVTSEEALSLTPLSIIKDIGPAKIVHSGKDLLSYIQNCLDNDL